MADGRQSSTRSGRGRGRARTVDQPVAAAPPGALPAQASSSDLGRRRATGPGRRTGTEKPEETSPIDKERRASPADVSPTDAEKMAGLELISLAQRPGSGRLGRPYRLCVNHFEMRILPKVLTVNQYHVEISHSISSVKMERDNNRPILWQCLLKNDQELGLNRDDMYKIAFDSVSNLYTMNPLRLPHENLVLREEIRGISEACLKVDATFKPKITFIIVQKRHHTRFFPANPDEGCGKARNVFPGTVVDTDILFHEDFNFYLCSHAGIQLSNLYQGTSRPTRYHVLQDDNQFSPDDMQSLTYYLCHCFSRCTRAVSIPAPVYYAHLACTRARAHLTNVVGDVLSDTASTRSGDQGHAASSIPEDQLIEGATVTDNIRKEMYFT